MRTGSLLVASLLGALLAAPSLADTVYLANGRSFEGVIADASDTQVRVQLPGGAITLPRSAVLRVEKADSSFAEYLRRKAELDRATRAGSAQAGDWLELARWARQNGLGQGSREAALAAADLDPRLSGLAPLMRGLGYVYEESLDRWIPYADSMRRRGFVQDEGQWISREEAAERNRVREQERRDRMAMLAARAQAAQAAQAARDAAFLNAQLNLYRQSVDPSLAYGLGGALFFPPGFFLSPMVRRPTDRRPARGDRDFDFDERTMRGLLLRPPGSLLPPSAFVPH